MEEAMTDARFPVASFAEALPYLRAPYTPELVYGRVMSAPENIDAPCEIALYVSSETVMSRLNIVCDRHWGVRFEEVAERTDTSGEKTLYYVQIRAYVTVFGRPFEDRGEATSDGKAMAEYVARAQSFKRAARWFEVGHCLYLAGKILMWRGPGDKQLRVPRSGKNPHRRPYLDERSERYIRQQYEEKLERIERIYGEPLDHLKAAQGRIAIVAPPPAADTQPQGNGASEPRSTTHAQAVLSPGMIVNPEVVQAARGAGFSETVARQMTQLARGEDQVGELPQPQAQMVQGWLASLSSLKVPEENVLSAIDLYLERSPGRDAARSKFAAWIEAKAETALAATAALADAQSPPPVTDAGDVPPAGQQTSPPAAAEQPQAFPNGQPLTVTVSPAAPARAAKDGQGEPPSAEPPLPALQELAETITHHDYRDDVVHRLIALSQGQGSEWQIAWERLSEKKLREITRLLGCAGQLGWDNARLGQMVMSAHNSAQQNTPAGRYSTFANRLTTSAEARASEAARLAA
jgi:hypothetical protein